MKTWIKLSSTVAMGWALAACASQPSEPAVMPTESAPPAEAPEAAASEAPPTDAARKLEVMMEAKSNSKLAGKAVLTETEGGVHVVLTLEGLTPGERGVHVHEKGDCSAPDGTSAGGHYNPDGLDHGLPGAAKRHLGDLGNITIGADGKGTLDITAPGANLKPNDQASFVTRSIIVHDKKDDGGQPTGNAGGRIGCGVITG
jgi:superoxide dismutase, Cu-Zn family